MNGLQLIELPETAEFIVTTNIKSPIKITGVATTNIRDSKQTPWRKGYLVFYEDCGVMKKAEVNQELYSALHLVFDTLNDLDVNDLDDNRFIMGDSDDV